ncbi:uncharacterized protein FOBCDRAFT_243921 [Fusarium oxysporum Fo47]|uniref:uncharacterized protein n=1 Tax=Fusarium oxysporum Fo47 TaxID=660027 RepID=UPI0028699310|nr:uncharacterized protein FOBCDRAFT_243921 [Fusarium oxysporum Fo47]WJG36194.1 hypothetical protein FOBCDRAFT_243921 [Fusarium oxysporum Fo47]
MATNIQPLPKLEVPYSQHVVDVSVIDSMTYVRYPLNFFLKNPLPGHENLECPSFVFLVRHLSGKKESISKYTLNIKSKKDITQILREDRTISLDKINSIIWSYWHTNYVNDLFTFPFSIELIRHAVGHICSLVCTSLSIFIFIGSNSYYYYSSLRPTIYPKHSCIEPYYSHLEQAHGRDVAKAADTIDKMIIFDASEDVFVILAYNKTLLDVMDFFPKSANR